MGRLLKTFWAASVGAGLSLAPFLASAGTIEMTGDMTTLDNTSAGEETFLQRQGERLMLVSNYSAGENNSDRYTKVFLSSPAVQFWAKAHHFTQSNASSVVRRAGFVYLVVTAGPDHERTQVWNAPVSEEFDLQLVLDTEVSFGNLAVTHFNHRLHVYGINDSGQPVAWKRKDGEMIESPFRLPVADGDAVQLHEALMFDGKVILFATVDNRPRLFESTDGKTFTASANYPLDKSSDQLTAIERGHGRLLIGATRDGDAVVFRTPNLTDWNRIYRKEQTDTTSYEVDFLRQGRNRVQMLRYEQTTADPGHPTVQMLSRRNGDWDRRATWENAHLGNQLVRLNGAFYASLNHGDGPTVATID